MTVFARDSAYRAKQRAAWTPERRAAQSARRKAAAVGVSITHYGYRVLTGQYVHPLAKNGSLAEHRMVLYDKIGPGIHHCHWCDKLIEWNSGDYDTDLCADHLDNDKLNNDPENLVPSCFECNWNRTNPCHPRLRDGDAEEIRAQYASGGMTQKRLADRYGITQGAVSRIINNQRRIRT